MNVWLVVAPDRLAASRPIHQQQAAIAINMNSDEKSSQHDFTLDELTVLCEVMVSLCKAGVPLDSGLQQLAQELPGRLGPDAEQISRRLRNGERLADVVSRDGGPFPEVYASVVEAGVRSGRITIALEGFARLAGQLSELRKLVVSSLVYPMILMVVLTVASVVVLQRLPLALGSFLDSHFLGATSAPNYQSFMSIYTLVAQWFWMLPIALIGVGVFWIAASHSAKAAETDGGNWLAWVPGAKRLLRNSRLLSFTDVLHLLVSQGVPLHEAIRLAGSASGDRGLRVDAAELATQVERGVIQSQPKQVRRRDGIPSFLRWGLFNTPRIGGLDALLDRARRTYRHRTEDAAMWLRTFLPVCASIGLGGFIAFLYVALFIIPWYGILKLIADPLRLPG